MRTFIILLLAISLFSSCSSKPDDSKTVFSVNQSGDSVAVIKPTFGQGQHYAYKSGNILGVVVAIIAISILVWLFRQIANEKMQMGWAPGLAMFVLGCAIIAGFLLKGQRVWLNNDKEIPIEQYRQTIKTDGSSKAIWDSLYDQNRLIDAAK
jgi:hypothetical protein